MHEKKPSPLGTYCKCLNKKIRLNVLYHRARRNLYSLALRLVATFTTLNRPWEMSDGNDEERITRREDC